mgnify:CR=1 FL=1
MCCPFELVQSVKMHEEVAALRAKETRLSEIAGEYESYLDELSEEDKEQNFVNDAKDAFVAAEVKKAIKAREVEPATMRILKDVDALFAEEKTLKKQVKDDSAALHQRTKGVIEGLTDEEVRDLLHRKWILPLMENLNSLPDAVLDDFVKQWMPSARNTKPPLRTWKARLPAPSTNCWGCWTICGK